MLIRRKTITIIQSNCLKSIIMYQMELRLQKICLQIKDQRYLRYMVMGLTNKYRRRRMRFLSRKFLPFQNSQIKYKRLTAPSMKVSKRSISLNASEDFFGYKATRFRCIIQYMNSVVNSVRPQTQMNSRQPFQHYVEQYSSSQGHYSTYLLFCHTILVIYIYSTK